MKFSKFFSILQEAPWYRSFLNPVINEVSTNGKLLDIGTGSGKLLEILTIEKKIECTGVDTSDDMMAEARIKLKNIKVALIKIKPNAELPFEDSSFNYITICSVLFHLKKPEIDKILMNCSQLLKKNGKIIILTPTGQGGFLKLSRLFLSLKNKSVFVWYRSTKSRAQIWLKEKYLKEYAEKRQLRYSTKIVMNGFAQLEILYN